MNIGVVGPGALGTFLAGMLGRRNDIVLLGRKDLGLEGVKVEGKSRSEVQIEYSTVPDALEGTDLVIICTKSYDTNSVLEEINQYVGADSKVLSLQNGLKNEAIISSYLDKEKIIGGITGHGVSYIEPGRVKHAGEGETYIGGWRRENDEKDEEIAEELSRCGIETELTDNIYGFIWEKVIINSGINPLTALTGCKNGYLVKNEELHTLLQRVCYESTKIAKNETELPSDDPVERAERVARLTADNRSSMLQDIDNERKTEIGCINGAIVDAGKKRGIDTPYNEALYHLIKGRESQYL